MRSFTFKVTFRKGSGILFQSELATSLPLSVSIIVRDFCMSPSPHLVHLRSTSPCCFMRSRSVFRCSGIGPRGAATNSSRDRLDVFNDMRTKMQEQSRTITTLTKRVELLEGEASEKDKKRKIEGLSNVP